MLMGLIAYFAAESVSHPLKKLKNAANKIAEGNFDVRTVIRTSDEIGELSHAFDSMAEKLQTSLLEIKDKENVIKQQEDILLQFSNYSEKHCVCLVDIVSSTKITANLSETQTSEFYKIFLNSIATIIRKFDGVVVKNIGDALLFYFPVLMNNEETILKKCLDCCLSICASHNELMKKIKNEKLPVFDYRLSSTYGMVRIAKISTSSVNDIFGATVNRCSKINYTAPKNGLVIGQDFYDSAKSFPEFNFEKVRNETLDTAHKYPSYIVTKHNG
jgi:class 3 adenylate cyclase